MFSLFPNSNAPLSPWLSHNAGFVALVIGTIALCSFLAWHFRHQNNGSMPDVSGDYSDSCDSSDGGGDCGD
jgi:hypothetical protein